MKKSNPVLHIDRFSFELGMINCFVEMVACGVKKLALSPPLTPDQYKKINPLSEQIVEAFGVCSWLEKKLIATDLQSDEFVAGKWVILYYKTRDVLESYEALKKRRLQQDNLKRLDEHEIKAISREFMRLLSYPENIIHDKLSGRHADPFLLIDS